MTVTFSLAPHHPLTPRIHRRLCAVGQVQLAEDVADVALHGVLAEYELLGDLGIVRAAGTLASQDCEGRKASTACLRIGFWALSL